jgi:RimJ/RimL family protein N-acetyltransferase
MKDEPKSLYETAAWLRRNRANFDLDKDYRYVIFDSAERTLIGETGLYTRAGKEAREIGYWINKQSAGKGYASEATMAMVKVAFEIDQVDRVEIHCAPENAISAAIPAKLGFTHEAILKRRFQDSEGGIQDSMILTLFAEDYPNSLASSIGISAYDCVGAKILWLREGWNQREDCWRKQLDDSNHRGNDV